MSLRERTRPGLGIVEPCLPSPAKAPPSGPGWIHEIKHDGFRILARRDSGGVRLITRAGNEFSHRFPFIALAVGKLSVRSCLIGGEAIVCDKNGLAVFDLIRGYGSKASAVLCAFDLLELNGECAENQSNPVSTRLCSSYRRFRRLSSLIIIMRLRARGYCELPASLVARVSCRSGLGRFTAPAAHHIG
jgi:ATP-dependent DNA ligase